MSLVVRSGNCHDTLSMQCGEEWLVPEHCACSRDKSGGYQRTVSTQRWTVEGSSGGVAAIRTLCCVHAIETGVVTTWSLSM